MKLYWPNAISSDGEKLWTYDSHLTTSECSKTFANWENGYQWLLTEMWIDVTDTEDPEYREKIEVSKAYVANMMDLSRAINLEKHS